MLPEGARSDCPGGPSTALVWGVPTLLGGGMHRPAWGGNVLGGGCMHGTARGGTPHYPTLPHTPHMQPGPCTALPRGSLRCLGVQARF